MRASRALLIVLLLTGACTTTPPLPPECTGELVPINGTASEAQQENKRETRPDRKSVV